MTTTDLPSDVNLTVAIRASEDTTIATVALGGLESDYLAEAEAPRSHGKLTIAPIDRELAVARALDAIHHQIMESIHERIDRSADDI
jgi:hypothetical protein